MAVLTPDLKWVAGSSGYVEAAAFKSFLEDVEMSPVLQATAEVAKKLEGLATQAEQGVEKSQWQKTIAAAKTASDLAGRSPLRDRIAAALTKARAWAETEMSAALASLAKAGDRTAARRSLIVVGKAFAGEAEAKEAEAGVKAADRLGVIEGMESDKQDAAREKAVRDFVGTRWTALFAKK